MTEDQSTEAAIVAAGADKAPRITPADIQANIVSEHYFTAHDGMMGLAQRGDSVAITPALQQLTFCVLVLRNGFTVTGHSACASPENFNAEIGRKVARENAVRELWPLMGYALKAMLTHMEGKTGLHDGIKWSNPITIRNHADLLGALSARVDDMQTSQPNVRIKTEWDADLSIDSKVMVNGEVRGHCYSCPDQNTNITPQEMLISRAQQEVVHARKLWEILCQQIAKLS